MTAMEPHARPCAERGGMGSAEAAALWRQRTGPVPDALELTFTAEAFSAGKPIDIELRGRDVRQRGEAEERAEAMGSLLGMTLLALLMATADLSTMMFVPLAISLAFGVLFATVITLLLVPARCT